MAILLAGLVAVGASTAFVIDALTNVPDFSEMKKSVKVPIELANKDKSFRMMGPQAPGWVPLSQISNGLIGAVVSSEDTSFFSHEGVDFHELKEAIKKDFQEKRWARGASTLTQQVVKNVYLGQQKTLWRKFKEFIWAQKMDKALSKSEILAFYLNMAEWGPGLYGVGEAARHYFHTSPASLSAKQGAFLAMLLPSPLKYHSYFQKKALTPWAQGRVNKILLVMKSMGFIDEGTYESAMAENLWEVADPQGTVLEGSSESEEVPEQRAAPVSVPESTPEAAVPTPPGPPSPEPESPPTPPAEEVDSGG